jgi:peptidoglycan/LPS O-acetylase OafA/YrhL
VEHAGNERFDVGRGLAALVVFGAHINQFFVWRFFQANSLPEMVSGWAARAGVLLFFLLSGLLITRSIISNIKRNGCFDPVDYLLNRLARLYPPFLFALVLTVAIVCIVDHFDLPGSTGALGTVRPNGITYDYRELVHSLFLVEGMTQANGPLWTLYIEVRFYLAAMGIAMIVRSQSSASKVLGTALVLVAAWFGLGLYKFWFFGLVWAAGAAANITAAKSLRVFLPIAIIAVFLTYLYPAHYIDYIDNNFGLTIQILGCLIATYSLLLNSWVEFKFPMWLMKTAKFSYTLYVVHFPLLVLGLSLSLAINPHSFSFAITSAILSSIAVLSIVIVAARPLEDVPKFKKYLSFVSGRMKVNERSSR